MIDFLRNIAQYLNLDLIGKLVAAVVGALGVLYQFRQLRATTRASIKTDLDILTQLDKESESYQIVKANVDASIKQVYAIGRKGRFVIYSPGDLIFGSSFLIGFSAWTVYLCRNGFSWWAIATAFFALAGFGGVMNAFDPKKQKAS